MKRNPILLLAIAVVAASFISVLSVSQLRAAGTTLYVTPTGSDTNNCSSIALACRQISRAVSLATAGTTILVADGTYNPFHVDSKNGTASAPITLKANGSNVVVNASSNDRGNIYVLNSSYIVVDGFRTFNATGGNGAGVGVRFSPHVTVKNITTGGNSWWGIFVSFSDYIDIENSEAYGSINQHGIYVSNSVQHAIVRNNRLHDNKDLGLHMNGDQYTDPPSGFATTGTFGTIGDALVENNVIYNNGAGMDMDGGHDSTIRNNLFYNNANKGIVLFQEDGAVSPFNISVYNNTVDSPSGAPVLRFTAFSGPIHVKNNILYSRGATNSTILATDENDPSVNANFDSDYNIFVGPNPCMALGGGACDGLTITNWKKSPYNKDAHSTVLTNISTLTTSATDYHLKTGSPAIDAGIALTGVTTDLEGNARPAGSGYDIGAYEFGALAATTPSPVATTSSNPSAAPVTPTPTPTLTGLPAISLIKTVDKTQATSGDILTYTITYSNSGITTANSVQITDTIPTGSSYVAGSATNSGTLANGVLTWTIPTITASGTGSNGTVSFQVTVN